MLALLARATFGPLHSLGRSPFSALAPWRQAAAALRAPVSWAPPLWCGAANPHGLLAVLPPAGLLPLLAGLKSKVSLKRRCKDCFVVRRRGRLYVYCKTNPRHKQRKL
ncbi:RM36 protein, partial [Geococcyx californianus]|nr:RM36 protein [Geococcyx californianus]